MTSTFTRVTALALTAILTAALGQTAPQTSPASAQPTTPRAPAAPPAAPSGALSSLRASVQQAATRFRGARVTDLRVEERPGLLTVTGRLDNLPFVARFPERWNRQSVLFAHGYVTPGTPETVSADRDPAGGLGLLVNAQNYAYAYSAYAKSGYAVKSGVDATHQLKKFLDAVGSRQAYATGASMGGNIVVALVEKFPNDYVGAMPFCGVTGGWGEEIRYLTDFRVLYDFFTRGTPYVLPGAGDLLKPNADFTPQVLQQRITALFTAAATAQDATVKATARTIIGRIAAASGANPDPTSFVTALAGFTYGLQDYLVTTGGNGYSNVGKVYRSLGDASDTALNAGVQRLTASPQARAYLDAWYRPTGVFKAKMLSFHNTIDPLVPFEHAALLRDVVTKAGNSANLVQQTVAANPTAPRHCDFTPGQVTFAWNELRAWVDRGVTPQNGLDITAK